MNRISKLLVISICLLLPLKVVFAYDFNYDQISREASNYTVVVDMEIEISFGTQTTEMKNRMIGSIVSSDGLVVFDGTSIDNDDPFSVMSGMQLNIEPSKIEITLMDERKYSAEFIGIDQFTKLAFCRIISEEPVEFKYLKLEKRSDYKIGEMLTTYILLPKFISPSLGVDVGLVSAVINEPEEFILTVGFNDMEAGSVLYDKFNNPVGILIRLGNQGQSEFGASQHSFSGGEDLLPLLGIGDVDKIQELINDPPKRGEKTRGWLGIHLQALTVDLAEFWGLNIAGGIIVNDVVEDSPADKAGLHTGDIIVKLNGRPIEVDSEETLPIFRRKILELAAGTQVDFEIFRREDGKVDTLDISAVLAQTPLSPAEADDYEEPNFEMTIRNMVFADYTIFNLDQNKFKGVVVKETESGGWASVGGIRPGDIIQSIGGTEVTNIDEAERVLKSLVDAKPKEVVFFVWRNNKTLFINIKTDW